MRLHKYLAHCGVASRRKSETIIRDGKVRVNGRVVTDMGVQIDPSKDRISVEGCRISKRAYGVYFLFYKPRGVVCTTADEKGRKCVSDYFRQQKNRLYPVGRLDKDSEGLLLITDDGDFANRVMHPRYGVEKEYRVTVDKAYKKEHAEALLFGIEIGESSPATAKEVRFQTRADGRSVVFITLVQGLNREVRRMLESQGYTVLRLCRTRIGALTLGDLKPGEKKHISQQQAQQVFHEADQGV